MCWFFQFASRRMTYSDDVFLWRSGVSRNLTSLTTCFEGMFRSNSGVSHILTGLMTCSDGFALSLDDSGGSRLTVATHTGDNPHLINLNGLSAVYGCGYNSCGFNLRLSEVRSGSVGVDLGPVRTALEPRVTRVLGCNTRVWGVPGTRVCIPVPRVHRGH